MPADKKHGRIIWISIFYLIFTSWLAAQDDLISDSVLVVTREPATWALQFKVDDCLSLGSLYGGNISLMQYTTPQLAVRFGLSVSVGICTESEEDEDIEVSENKNKSASIIFETHYLKHPKPSLRGRMYWGAGPIFSASYSIAKEDYFNGGTTEEHIQWDLSVGAVGVMGYSWQVAERLELFAEYLTELLLIYSYEESGYSFYKNINKGWAFSTQPGATVLGISLYF